MAEFNNNQEQREALEKFANDYVILLKRTVPKNTGKLAQSIKAKVDDDSVDIDAMNYINFLDQGVSGTKTKYRTGFGYKNKKPPISSLQGFARKTGINVYALQKSIFEDGIKPEGFITNTIDRETNELANELAEAVWTDFATDENKKEKQTK